MPLLPDYHLKDFRLRHLDRYILIKGVHWLVVSVSLIATIIAWQVSLSGLNERIQISFDRKTDNAIHLFKSQMNRYADMLRLGDGLISTNKDISNDQWLRFTERVGLEERFPAIGGIGVVYRVELDALDEFVEKQRKNKSDFSIKPLLELNTDQGRQYILPLSLMSPRSLADKTLGLNIRREARRNEAIKRSVETGTIQITAPILPEVISDPGFAMIAPIFKTTKPETVALRQSEFIGAVVAAVSTRNLATGILDSGFRQVAMQVSDNNEIIYDELRLENNDLDADPLVTGSRTLALFGRNWHFDIHSNKSFRMSQSTNTPTLVLVGGLTIDTLLLLLFMHMSRAHQQATAYGKTISLMYEKQSVDLRTSYETLEDRNKQLESYSYVVSHDLKAPLRGIWYLATCLQEDIDDHQPATTLPSSITSYAQRIKKQVTLAQGLIQGVLQYSGLGTDDKPIKTVNVVELLHSLRVMLAMDETQLHLLGEFPTFQTYETQLTQVFMNLIGNAYKYHPDPTLAVVTIGVEESASQDYYRFTVADNGPGIDQAYHKKIFEPFTTLQPKDHSMSSGMGLAIVKKVLALNGGNIEVASEEGKGTQFTFDWPSTVIKEISDTEPALLPKAA